MSPVLLAAVLVGQVALVSAGLALSRVVQALQFDARRPGAIIDRPEQRTPMAVPLELEIMERLVTDAIASEATAAKQLHPVLAELGRDAPGGRLNVPSPPGRDRRRWIVATLPELERAWGIEPPA